MPKRPVPPAYTPTAGSAARPATWGREWPSPAGPTRPCVSPAWTVSTGRGTGRTGQGRTLSEGPPLCSHQKQVCPSTGGRAKKLRVNEGAGGDPQLCPFPAPNPGRKAGRKKSVAKELMLSPAKNISYSARSMAATHPCVGDHIPASWKTDLGGSWEGLGPLPRPGSTAFLRSQ